MLASTEMVGFLLTKDYDKARAFYEGNLGFEFVSLDQFALVMQAVKSMIRIVKDPTFTPLRSTVLGWQVDNIEAIVDWLTKRGVVFEKYPFARQRARDLDRARWQQNRVVCGSRRKCVERLGAPLNSVDVNYAACGWTG